MPFVKLRNNWVAGQFRRTIIPKSGRAKSLTFQRGIAVEVTAKDLKLLKPDIGLALVECDKNGTDLSTPVTGDDQDGSPEADLIIENLPADA